MSAAPGMRRVSTGRIGLIALFWLLTLISLYPLVWLVLSSLKTSSEMFGEAWALPKTWRWSNYASAWSVGISRYLVSSVIVTGLSTLFVVLISAASAYALVVLRLPFRTGLYAMILGGLILPPEVALFPLFRILGALGILNTYWALIVPYTAFGIPFTTFLIRAYMVKIPPELAEAAKMDGAGPFWTFLHVYLPLCRPVLASAALIQSMRSWNEFIFALTFVESESVKPITIGMMSFANALRSDWSILMAGLVISIVPVLAVFLILQRQFIGGLTQGAVK